MGINLNFHPKLYKDEEAFNALPMDEKEMQNMAMRIGTFVMRSLADVDKKETALTQDKNPV